MYSGKQNKEKEDAPPRKNMEDESGRETETQQRQTVMSTVKFRFTSH
jgi:hypothetical protein